MDFLLNLTSNILANAIFWLGLGFVAWLAIQITQSRFLNFFDLKTNRRLAVYLSNLWKPKTERPEGYIISEHEFRASESINRLFGSTPFRLPELVRGLVDSFWLGSALAVNTTVSPITTDKIAFSSNMIIIGGISRNIVRRYYVHTSSPYLVLANELEELHGDHTNIGDDVFIMKGNRKNETIKGDYNFAIIEKIRDEEHNITIFMCVGFRGDSSWGATEYLVRHWRDIHKKYRDKEFALCLGFPKTQSYLITYEEPIILTSLPF